MAKAINTPEAVNRIKNDIGNKKDDTTPEGIKSYHIKKKRGPMYIISYRDINILLEHIDRLTDAVNNKIN